MSAHRGLPQTEAHPATTVPRLTLLRRWAIFVATYAAVALWLSAVVSLGA